MGEVRRARAQGRPDAEGGCGQAGAGMASGAEAEEALATDIPTAQNIELTEKHSRDSRRDVDPIRPVNDPSQARDREHL